MVRFAHVSGLCRWLCVAAVLSVMPAAESATTAPDITKNAETPRTVGELKAIEARVKDVVKKALPATVAVLEDGAQGSGVVVTKDGYVLTAGHVAGEPGRSVTLVLSDGRRVKAKSLGVNHGIDSGMLKITEAAPAGGFAYVEMGKSSDLVGGQWAVALGHPGGYRKDRPPVVRLGRILMATPKMVATDCTLIMGDSGGPLFDLSGKLIGIHSRIGPTTVQNISVPIDTFRQTWDRLAAGDSWGKTFVNFSAGGNAVLGVTAVEDDKGCRVARVVPDSPAAKAGVKVGDIIQRFNTQDVKNPDQLVEMLAKRKPGDAVKIEVLRDQKAVELTAKLGARQF